MLCEFTRLTDMNLVETFTAGVEKFSLKLVTMKKHKTESDVVGQLREQMNVAKVQNLHECK